MATSSEDGLTFCYEEGPCFFNVSVSQVQSRSRYPSFSQGVEAQIGMVQPTEVQFSWSEEHCRRRRRFCGRILGIVAGGSFRGVC
jgi:hypothetical protein